jgi:LemA protein
MTIFYVLLGIAVFAGFVAITTYNSIIKLRNIRKQAFANIDVQLKQRFNLIPNLVSTVK